LIFWATLFVGNLITRRIVELSMQGHPLFIG
jgi:hypothetical protein